VIPRAEDPRSRARRSSERSGRRFLRARSRKPGLYNFTEKDRYGLDTARGSSCGKDGKYTPAQSDHTPSAQPARMRAGFFLMPHGRSG